MSSTPKAKQEEDMAEFKYHNMVVDESRLALGHTPRVAVEAARAMEVLTEWVEFNQYPQEGANVNVFDPKAKQKDGMAEFKYHNMVVDENRLVLGHTLEAAAETAQARAVLDELKPHPYFVLYNAMIKPTFLSDGRCFQQ